MQRLDGLEPHYLWNLNSLADPPDLAVILTADPDLIAARLATKGRTIGCNAKTTAARPRHASTKKPRSASTKPAIEPSESTPASSRPAYPLLGFARRSGAGVSSSPFISGAWRSRPRGKAFRPL